MKINPASGPKSPADSLFLAAWVLSLNSSQEPDSVQNGKTPSSFGDFDFLDGEFDGIIKRGGLFETIHWQAERLLNGWIIRDEIKHYNHSGVLIADTIQVSTYSSDQDCWKQVQFDSSNRKVRSFSGTREGNIIVLDEEHDLLRPVDQLKRQLLIPSGKRKFTRAGQVSVDDGESWFEDGQPLTLHKIM